MSAHMHIANNYNDVVDVITSLIAIYARTISVEPTLQQAIHKRQEHTQIASKRTIPYYHCYMDATLSNSLTYKLITTTSNVLFLNPSQLISNILELTELSIHTRKLSPIADPYKTL